MQTTSERIASDVIKLHETLHAIVTAHGVIVKNDPFRKGRQAARYQENSDHV